MKNKSHTSPGCDPRSSEYLTCVLNLPRISICKVPRVVLLPTKTFPSLGYTAQSQNRNTLTPTPSGPLVPDSSTIIPSQDPSMKTQSFPNHKKNHKAFINGDPYTQVPPLPSRAIKAPKQILSVCQTN
ncbi:hypothetical protein [Marmot herpesvirus 1]|nr:hypothetical protein [Marmot herpesvirus 1]